MKASLDRSRETSSGALVSRLLELPALPAVVRSLDDASLTRLVRQVGLEDAGAVVALATPRQLEALLDADAWVPGAPGDAERFDPGRFALWLAVLVEADPDAAAEKLTGLDETFLAMAFSRLVRVFDGDRLRLAAAAADEDDDLDAFDKQLEGRLGHEFDQYWVVAREEEGWDAILDVLTSLSARAPRLFDRVLARCAALTDDAAAEEGGYAALLSADDALVEEAADDRDERRSAAGFVAPPAAKSLLGVLRRARVEDILAESAIDPVVATYLPALDEEDTLSAVPPSADAAALAAWLAAEETRAQGGARALPSPALAGPFARAMQALRDGDSVAWRRCRRDLAFLANVLVAGEALRPAEAAEAVVATCDRGNRLAAERAPSRAEAALAQPWGVVWLFRLGAAG